MTRVRTFNGKALKFLNIITTKIMVLILKFAQTTSLVHDLLQQCGYPVDIIVTYFSKNIPEGWSMF